MDGSVKKGANTVANMLYHAIKRELNLDLPDKIFLFSDNCGGQNKNYMLLIFWSLLSKHLQLEITHLFPVRGHTYCSCDRNFEMYGSKKKNVETIETPEEYF